MPPAFLAVKCDDAYCPSRMRCHRFTAADGPNQEFGQFDRRGDPSCSWFMPRRG